MTYHTKQKKRSKYIFVLPIFFAILLFNVFVGYIMHFSIIAATCMTTAEVSSDSRCLYIYNSQIYEMGSLSNPHHGHPCGTDVTAILPSSHQDGRLLPNYIADVCPAITNTPSPTATPMLTITTAVSPTLAGSGSVTFSVTTLLHGLGLGGDNANPSSGGTTTPLHPQRPVTITVLDGNNSQVGKLQGNVTYATGAGNFTGQVSGNLPAGTDLVLVKVDGFLSKQVPGIITINPGTTITLPSVTLVNGDINNDGQIDVSDYNSLISCYGSKQTSASCLHATASDINDDGVVNGGDYNLFLRELSVQKGT